MRASGEIRSDRWLDYGIDAPGVVATLSGLGVGGVLLGGAVIAFAPWQIAVACGWLLVIASLVPGTLGMMMIAYALVGKRRFRDWMLTRHPWRGDESVLDVGAGRGLMTVGAAHRAPAGRVTAIDIWRPEDLTHNDAGALKRNAEAAGVADLIQIETMDARRMSFPDNCFDVVVSLLCVHNIEPESARMDALREIVRVLKPGGAAYIADYTAVTSYAKTFRDAGLDVTGPTNAVPIALSLMFLVEARKPVG